MNRSLYSSYGKEGFSCRCLYGSDDQEVTSLGMDIFFFTVLDGRVEEGRAEADHYVKLAQLAKQPGKLDDLYEAGVEAGPARHRVLRPEHPKERKLESFKDQLQCSLTPLLA